MAESFVKALTRDYTVSRSNQMQRTLQRRSGIVHPRSALCFRSPREYLWRRTSNGVSDNRRLEIQGLIHRRSGVSYFLMR